MHNAKKYRVVKAICLMIVSVSVFFTSCSSLSKSLTDEGWPKYTHYYTYNGPSVATDGEFWHNEGLPGYGNYQEHVERGRFLSPLVVDDADKDYKDEIRPIVKLEHMKKSSPDNPEKYDRMLAEEVKKMSVKRDNRIKQRLEFIQGFYDDLFKFSVKDFTHKYKKHCSETIVGTMQYLYQKNHKDKGLSWVIFCDNKVHGSNDFEISQQDGQSIDSNEKYPFSWLDNPFYQVRVNGQNIVLKVEGKGKKIIITGIANPFFDIVVDKYTDIPSV